MSDEIKPFSEEETDIYKGLLDIAKEFAGNMDEFHLNVGYKWDQEKRYMFAEYIVGNSTNLTISVMEFEKIYAVIEVSNASKEAISETLYVDNMNELINKVPEIVDPFMETDKVKIQNYCKDCDNDPCQYCGLLAYKDRDFHNVYCECSDYLDEREILEGN